MLPVVEDRILLTMVEWMSMENWWQWCWQGKTKSVRRKTYHSATLPSSSSYGLNRDRTRASGIRGRGIHCLSHGTALNIGTVAYRAQKHRVRLIRVCDCVIGITRLASCFGSKPMNGFGGNLVDACISYGCLIFIAIFRDAFVLTILGQHVSCSHKADTWRIVEFVHKIS